MCPDTTWNGYDYDKLNSKLCNLIKKLCRFGETYRARQKYNRWISYSFSWMNVTADLGSIGANRIIQHCDVRKFVQWRQILRENARIRKSSMADCLCHSHWSSPNFLWPCTPPWFYLDIDMSGWGQNDVLYKKLEFQRYRWVPLFPRFTCFSYRYCAHPTYLVGRPNHFPVRRYHF